MTAEQTWEAVFWDIGGVILSNESVPRGQRKFVHSLVDTYDTSLTPEQAFSEWQDTIGAYFREREGAAYRPAREGYRRGVEAILDVDADSIDWKREFDRVVAEEVQPNPGAVETIRRLSEADLHLGVLSDVDDDEGRRILDAFGVLDSFDAVTTSESVGRTKPDPAMFEAALEKADVAPSSAVMIGDRYTHDMEGGREAGLTTVSYGAEDGPAVDHHVEDLREIPALLGVDP